MKKWLIIIIVLFVTLIIGSFIYINNNFLYNPFTYPEGNIAEYPHYSFKTFKNPMVLQAVKRESDGNRSFYHYVTNKEQIKNLLNHFDKANKLENYDGEQYLSENPPNKRGAKYEIIFRRVESWDENNLARGRILIQFSFYENSKVFEIAGVHFYELKDSFKEDIFRALSDKEKWITD
ncbi:hypothetical protein E3U55_15860 [Filobacillus milosensis]|uniref:Uncharacterized protein n=1 Tax=Filobacillus milosensis TaxID=94137 RepID=A0A4Y8ICF7_9BACI|nr:hypothetical protein [Filobacillus milosensis]TFB13594.1 hypothetical protein E3U55_15860 [Filobacillus milosensis]